MTELWIFDDFDRFGRLGTQTCASPSWVHPALFESSTSARSRKTAVRQNVEVAGHRKSELSADGIGKSLVASRLAWQLGMPTVQLDL
jgi:hypothetical protein